MTIDGDYDGGIDDSKKFVGSGGYKGDTSGIGLALVGRKREELRSLGPDRNVARIFFAILLM